MYLFFQRRGLQQWRSTPQIRLIWPAGVSPRLMILYFIIKYLNSVVLRIPDSAVPFDDSLSYPEKV